MYACHEYKAHDRSTLKFRSQHLFSITLDYSVYFLFIGSSKGKIYMCIVLVIISFLL